MTFQDRFLSFPPAVYPLIIDNYYNSLQIIISAMGYPLLFDKKFKRNSRSLQIVDVNRYTTRLCNRLTLFNVILYSNQNKERLQ
jgi:hypothetical protein